MDKGRSENHWHKKKKMMPFKSTGPEETLCMGRTAGDKAFQQAEEEEEQSAKGTEKEGPMLEDRRTVS